MLEFIEKVKALKETGPKADAIWSDFSQKWFTLMHSTRPFIFRDYQEIADHVSQISHPFYWFNQPLFLKTESLS
jgi:poly [ADP-ribose] polymerase 2/3/4